MVELYNGGRYSRSIALEQVGYLDELERAWGRRWGAQSEFGKLRMAMVSRPIRNEIDADVEADPVSPLAPADYPDFDRLVAQHDAFVETLRAEGVEVVYMEVDPGARGTYGQLLRMTWAPASAFVINGGAIIPRYGLAKFRRGFEVILARNIMKIGCPILYTVHGHGIMELGGNCQWLDPEHLIIGVGPTTNMEGVEQVREVFYRAGVREIHIAYFTEAIHLDIVFGLAGPWVGVVDPRRLDYQTIKYIRSRGIDLIEVPEDEAKNCACNILAIEPSKVIIPSGNGFTANALAKRGGSVIELDFSEFVKIGGGPHCATCCLIRDPGPLLPKG